MNAADFLAYLRTRHVLLTADEGQLLVDAPEGALSHDDRVALIAHKPALLALLQTEHSPATPIRSPMALRDRSEPCKSIYAEVTAGYGTCEDLEACAWLDTTTDRDVVREIAALQRRCDELEAAGASEAGFKAAVEALVGRLDEVRGLYEAAQTAEAAMRVRH